MKNLSLIICVFLLAIACKREKKVEKNTEKDDISKALLKDYMIGNWETSYIKIEMPTVNKTDSLQVFEDDFSNPNSGKAQSSYKEDGTFSAWFLQPDGKKSGVTNGTWKTKGDSLYVDYPYIGKQVQAWYLITKTKEGFEGKVIYDWDNDGEFDDKLLMKSKRITITN